MEAFFVVLLAAAILGVGVAALIAAGAVRSFVVPPNEGE